jgi:hypothetical protein
MLIGRRVHPQDLLPASRRSRDLDPKGSPVSIHYALGADKHGDGVVSLPFITTA